jgi:hypothetical protein
MKPLAPVAGKPISAHRRRLLAALLSFAALLQTGSATASDAAPPDAPDRLLVPQGYLVGGFSAAVSMRPGRAPSGEYIKLIFPSALAASGPDLYVADFGQRMLLRIDTVSQALTRLREIPPLPGVRLETGADGSVYVLRPDRGEVERLARDGRRLGSFASEFEILRPSDLVVEPMLNQVWIADSAGGVFAFHPSGRMSHPLVGRGDGFGEEFSGATLLAAGRARVIGFDPRCRCVLEFDREGATIGSFAHNELLDPTDLAIDAHDRSWVLDRGDRTLKVFDGGRLVASIPAAQLGLSGLTAMTIDVYRVYIADGPGGRIGIFAILPPSRRAP